MAASQAGLEAVFLRSLLSDMGYKQSKPTDLYVDNKGAIDLSHDYMANDRTKHIARRHFKVRELAYEGHLRVEHIDTADNPADMLTKALPLDVFARHRATLMNNLHTDNAPEFGVARAGKDTSFLGEGGVSASVTWVDTGKRAVRGPSAGPTAGPKLV
mgnify:CR=1 FL=1